MDRSSLEPNKNGAKRQNLPTANKQKVEAEIAEITVPRTENEQQSDTIPVAENEEQQQPSTSLSSINGTRIETITAAETSESWRPTKDSLTSADDKRIEEQRKQQQIGITVAGEEEGDEGSEIEAVTLDVTLVRHEVGADAADTQHIIVVGRRRPEEVIEMEQQQPDAAESDILRLLTSTIEAVGSMLNTSAESMLFFYNTFIGLWPPSL